VTYLSLNPVVGLEILPNLSIGAGVSVNYAEADLKQGLFSTTDSDYFRFKGDGWGVSGNLGVLWKPHEKVALGASVRVPSNINLDGRTEFASSSAPVISSQRMDAQADFPFPIKVVAGISVRPTPDWNIEFDADYTDWSALGTVTIKQSAAFAPLPRDLPLVLNWEGSWYYEFGVTRYLPRGWLVSAGYIFNQNSDPNPHYTPLAADLDRHFFSLGIGHRGTRWDYDIAYQFGYGPSSSVSGSAPSPIGQTADGNYSFISHAVAVSVGLHF
jgi:long-chain fatty acid transport protein